MPDTTPKDGWTRLDQEGRECGWCGSSAWVHADAAHLDVGGGLTLFVVWWDCPKCYRLNFWSHLTAEPPGDRPDTPWASKVLKQWEARSAVHAAVKNVFVEIPAAKHGPDLPQQAPMPLAALYWEASAVLSASPRASAALSRRCLEEVLKDQGFTKGTLYNRLSELERSPKSNASLSKYLHGVKEFGNLAAHGSKRPEVPDVEQGEARWCLEVIRELVDYFYARPERERKKLEAVNSRLREAGARPMEIGEGGE